LSFILPIPCVVVCLSASSVIPNFIHISHNLSYINPCIDFLKVFEKKFSSQPNLAREYFLDEDQMESQKNQQSLSDKGDLLEGRTDFDMR
jgi:hypothetical protein